MDLSSKNGLLISASKRGLGKTDGRLPPRSAAAGLFISKGLRSCRCVLVPRWECCARFIDAVSRSSIPGAHIGGNARPNDQRYKTERDGRDPPGLSALAAGRKTLRQGRRVLLPGKARTTGSIRERVFCR